MRLSLFIGCIMASLFLTGQSSSVEVLSKQDYGIPSQLNFIGAADTFPEAGYLLGSSTFRTNNEGLADLEPQVYRVDESGEVIDSALFTYAGLQFVRSLKVSPDGNIWLVMEDVSGDTDANTNIRITRLDAGLNELGSELFSTPDVSENIIDLAVTNDNVPVISYHDDFDSESPLFIRAFSFGGTGSAWTAEYPVNGGFQFGGKLETDRNNQLFTTLQAAEFDWVGVAYLMDSGEEVFSLNIDQPNDCIGNDVSNPGLSRPTYNAQRQSYFMVNSCFDIIEVSTANSQERYVYNLLGFDQQQQPVAEIEFTEEFGTDRISFFTQGEYYRYTLDDNSFDYEGTEFGSLYGYERYNTPARNGRLLSDNGAGSDGLSFTIGERGDMNGPFQTNGEVGPNYFVTSALEAPFIILENERIIQRYSYDNYERIPNRRVKRGGFYLFNTDGSLLAQTVDDTTDYLFSNAVLADNGNYIFARLARIGAFSDADELDLVEMDGNLNEVSVTRIDEVIVQISGGLDLYKTTTGDYRLIYYNGTFGSGSDDVRGIRDVTIAATDASIISDVQVSDEFVNYRKIRTLMTADGSLYTAGTYRPNTNQVELVKSTASGAIDYRILLGDDTFSSRFQAFKISYAASDNTILISGVSRSATDNFNGRTILVKVNAEEGEVIWQRGYNGEKEFTDSAIATFHNSSDSIVLARSYTATLNEYTDRRRSYSVELELLDSTGEIIAREEILSDYLDRYEIYDLSIDEDNRAIVSGSLFDYSIQQNQAFWAKVGYQELVGTEEIENRLTGIPLIVAPNPTENMVKVSWAQVNGSAYQLSVFDHAGRLLSDQVGNAIGGSNVKTIDLANYPNGIYFLRLRNSEGISTQRVVKQ